MKVKIGFVISIIVYLCICGINYWLLKDNYAKNLLKESTQQMEIVDKSFSKNTYTFMLYSDKYNKYVSKNVDINEYALKNKGDTVYVDIPNADLYNDKYLSNADSIFGLYIILFIMNICMIGVMFSFTLTISIYQLFMFTISMILTIFSFIYSLL